MNNVKANYSFEATPVEKGYSYNVKPRPYGRRLGVWIGFLVALILFIPVGSIAGSSGSILIRLVILAVITFLTTKGILSWINNKIRKPSTFYIDNEVLKLNGHNYPREDISGLYIKHPREGAIDYGHGGGTFIVGGSSISGVLGASLLSSGIQLNRELSASLWKSIHANQYAIYMLFGEKKIKIAGGLNETSSKLLFDQIVKNHS